MIWLFEETSTQTKHRRDRHGSYDQLSQQPYWSLCSETPQVPFYLSLLLRREGLGLAKRWFKRQEETQETQPTRHFPESSYYHVKETRFTFFGLYDRLGCDGQPLIIRVLLDGLDYRLSLNFLHCHDAPPSIKFKINLMVAW
jgi:hypothetical protein